MSNPYITNQAAVLCQCPVDWEKLPGYNIEDDDVVRVLNREWVRIYNEFCVDDDDLSFLEGAVLGEILQDEIIDTETFANLSERVPLAREKYLQEIGRLGSVKFITPSEQGKHYSISGVKAFNKKISVFYRDYSEEDLWKIFWFWFGNAFALKEEDGSLERFPEFLLNAGSHWNKFRQEGSFRIALSAASPVGELNKKVLKHICIDIGLGGESIAHAYPVTEEESVKISYPLNVITANIMQIIGGD